MGTYVGYSKSFSSSQYFIIKVKESNLQQIKDKYKVAIIPEAMDNNINIQFRQDSIADIIKDPIDKRYYNRGNLGLSKYVCYKIFRC